MLRAEGVRRTVACFLVAVAAMSHMEVALWAHPAQKVAARDAFQAALASLTASRGTAGEPGGGDRLTAASQREARGDSLSVERRWIPTVARPLVPAVSWNSPQLRARALRMSFGNGGRHFAGTGGGASATAVRAAPTAANGGSGSSDTGLAIFAAAVIGSGFALSLYGDSNKCRATYPTTRTCDNLSSVGIGLLIGGTAITVIGLIDALKRDQDPYVPPSPPPLPLPPPTVAPVGGETSPIGREMATIRRSNPDQIPPAQRSRRNPGGATTLRYENGTSHVLWIYLTGVAERAITLQPGESATLDVIPGTYEIGARVSAPFVTPFHGTHIYERGWEHYFRFFIRATP